MQAEPTRARDLASPRRQGDGWISVVWSNTRRQRPSSSAKVSASQLTLSCKTPVGAVARVCYPNRAPHARQQPNVAPTLADLRVLWGGRDRLLKVTEVAEQLAVGAWRIYQSLRRSGQRAGREHRIRLVPKGRARAGSKKIEKGG
jgi:hypothetical protein